MTTITSACPTYNLRGSAIQSRDMAVRWLEFIGKHIFKYRLDVAKVENSFSVEARARSSGEWTICRVTTESGKSRLIRGPEDIQSDRHDRYMVYVSLRDEIEFEQFGRARKARALYMTLVSGTDSLSHSKLGDNDTLCFGIPRKFVEQRVLRAENICAAPISVSDGLGGLVRHSLMALYHESHKMSDEEFLSSSQILADLALLSLSTRADLSTSASFVRTHNLARAKRLIRARMGESDLRPAQVARGCGISLSYLHNLFRDDGRSVGEYLMETRLTRALQLLQSHTGNVTEVALTCGFSNLSFFSTAFRNAYGMPPRDVLRKSASKL